MIILFTALLAFQLPSSYATSSFPINVWPKPTTFYWPSPYTTTLLSTTFTISTTTTVNRHLTAAVRRYLHLVLSENHRPLFNISTNTTTPLSLLLISITNPHTPLSHSVDESYTLLIPSSTTNNTSVANLTASTVWGAMRGLETFSQLVYGSPPRVAIGIEIVDSPIYPHRGLMLDTSRNYYAVEDIMRTIGAMSMNKMNVFHWHITDSHSFPLVLPSVPDLADKGAYGEEMVYSVEDVRMIVEFGFEHGVRVLPEIDAPG